MRRPIGAGLALLALAGQAAPLAAQTGAPIVGCAPLVLAVDGPRSDEAFDPTYAPDRVLADGEGMRGIDQPGGPLGHPRGEDRGEQDQHSNDREDHHRIFNCQIHGCSPAILQHCKGYAALQHFWLG